MTGGCYKTGRVNNVIIIKMLKRTTKQVRRGGLGVRIYYLRPKRLFPERFEMHECVYQIAY